MNGMLVVNKPSNCTSRDVVNIICKKFNTKKVGHTGTLDPMATGVLIVLIGKYTNLVEVITSYDKVYEAEITLGTSTDTLDITGNILKEENTKVNLNEIKSVLNSMIGTYEQEVPKYSAVKIDGKKLYDYVRNNKDIELPKRLVEIKSLELISDIKYRNNKTIFKIRTCVSKGTYIRSLINDISKKLNTIGVMSELKRIKQGNIDIRESFSIDEILNDKYSFYNINNCFKDIFTIDIDENLYKKVKNGIQLKNIYGKEIILFKYNGNNIAIYKNDKNILKMWKYLL